MPEKITLSCKVIKCTTQTRTFSTEEIFEAIVKYISVFENREIDLYQEADHRDSCLHRFHTISIPAGTDVRMLSKSIVELAPIEVLRKHRDLFGDCKFLEKADIKIYE